MLSWSEAVVAHVKKQLTKEKFADGKVFTSQSKPHQPGTIFPQWDDSFKTLILQLQRQFVVTNTDKLPNNYAVCCAKYYVGILARDLQSDYFARVLGLGEQTATQVVAERILQAVNALAKDVYCVHPTTAMTIQERMIAKLQVLPYAKALVKFHKQPLQMRFLACSGDNGLKPVALWLTGLFRAIHNDLVREWHKLLGSTKVTWAEDSPWYVTRSAQIVEMLHDFNSVRVSREQFVRTGGWQGFDFARLYTNIPQTDLIQALHWVLKELVRRKSPTESFPRKTPGSTVAGPGCVPRRCFRLSGGI
jgi:hypothetical protein